MKLLNKLSFDQKIIVCLTTIIAVAAVVQATSAIVQVNLFAESALQDRQRERPSLMISPVFSPLTREPGKVGFDIVNRSHFQITIDTVGLTKGSPIDDEEAKRAAKSIGLPYVTKSTKSDMSDLVLPVKLGYGEALEVRYERDKIIDELSKWTGKTPLPVRPYCIDSLGNYHYTPDLWITWTEGSEMMARDPGPDFEQIDAFYVYL